MQKIYLCSFADTRLGISMCRFKQEAMNMGGGVFDEIFIYTEASLPLKFREDFKDKFYNENGVASRGFGYWVWKPKIILMVLEQIKENDILFYLDIGFEFNSSKAEMLKDYINQINQNEIMALATDGETQFEWEGKQFYLTEKYWTKMDALVHFGLDKDEEFLNSANFAAGFIALKKTKQNIKIIEKWLNVFYKHWNFVDDSPSKIPNFDCFIENRHDQSIWNIIAKTHNVKAFPKEFYHQSYNTPLICARNKIYLPDDVNFTKMINEMIRVNGFNHILSQTTQIKALQRKINFGTAKARIHNHLAYKMGQILIRNSKSFFGYVKMPYLLIALNLIHKGQEKAYKEKIKTYPNLTLPPLESYSDYKEALKEKECFTYKLGFSFMKAHKSWYKGGYLRFFFKELPRLNRELSRKRK